MLKADVFDDFKGATTLLLWGDREGIATLLAGLSELRNGRRDELPIDGPKIPLIVRSAPDLPGGSSLQLDGNGYRWNCSRGTLRLASELVEPLLHRAGHQFFDVSGLAQQIIISRDEYPSTLR